MNFLEEMKLFNEDDTLCDKLRNELLVEFKENYKNGVYGYLQKVMTYYSNNLEGSTLTQDQTSMLFDTKTLSSDDAVYRAKDIEEAQGHFLAFNHLLKTMKDDLDETLIKALHYCLKAGVFDDRLNGRPIGEYKNRPNIAGGTKTVLPADVKTEMEKLLLWYNDTSKTLENIAQFHARFEKIHPFQDGNGRVGRLIIFRECLVNNICPIVIKGEQRLVYIKALKSAQAGDVSALVRLFQEDQADLRENIRYFIEN